MVSHPENLLSGTAGVKRSATSVPLEQITTLCNRSPGNESCIGKALTSPGGGVGLVEVGVADEASAVIEGIPSSVESSFALVCNDEVVCE